MQSPRSVVTLLRRRAHGAGVFAAWLVLAGWAAAQGPADSPSPALRGRVADTTGGVIIGALVDVDAGSGRRAQAITDERGEYRFATLPPGRYLLTATFAGFAPRTRQVDIAEGRPARADLTLEVSIDEQVDVTSHVTLQDSPLTRTLTRQELTLLPDDSRRLLQRLRELAGSRARPGDVVIYVDGFREGTRVPPKSRIQMVRISTHPFSAEFQEPGRARVEITTRPGAARVTADLGVTFNNEQLTAPEYFAPGRPDSRLLHYTSYLAAPLWRDRLGVTAFAGRWDEDSHAVYNATVVDPATLQPAPASGTVVSPERIDSVLAGVNSLAGRRHTMMLLYGYEGRTARGLGLDSAFDLPDRAYSQDSRALSGRGSLLSIVSPTLLNDVHVELGRRESGRQAVSAAPATLVLDAFRAGGNQEALFYEEHGDTVQLRDTLTHQRGSHTLKAGLQAEFAARRIVDRTGFGGAYLFGADVERDATGAPLLDPSGAAIPVSPLERYRRTLAGLPGYGPSQFSLVTGDEALSFEQWWLSWFAQDDWMPFRRFTLSFGVRQDWQSYLDRRRDVAGRLGVGWTIDEAGRNVVRGGVGLFHARLGPDLAVDTTRYDGNRQLRIVVANPSFYPVAPPPGGPQPATVHRKAPDMQTPRTLMTTVSYERALPWNLTGAVEYAHEDGRHLLLRRNVNRPGPDGAPPVPGFGPILQYESLGRSKSDSLLVSLRLNASRRLTLSAGYTRTWSTATTDGYLSAPADPDDLEAEWAMPAHDREHRAFASGTLYLPWQIYVSPHLTASSGRPFNITTGRDANGDSLFSERPGFAADGDPSAIVTPFGRFTLTPGAGAMIPRNFGRGEPEFRLDLHVSKLTALGGGVKVTVACDVHNALNSVNFSQYHSVVTSPLLGEPSRALAPRRVLLSARLSY